MQAELEDKIGFHSLPPPPPPKKKANFTVFHKISKGMTPYIVDITLS